MAVLQAVSMSHALRSSASSLAMLSLRTRDANTRPFMSSDQSHGRLTSVWPSHSYKVLSFVVYLIVAAALNHIVASRAGAAYQDVRHPQWQSPAWSARIYLFLAFLASFLLIILSGVLQFGIGLSDTETVCHAAVVICGALPLLAYSSPCLDIRPDILYVSTKIFICGFLLCGRCSLFFSRQTDNLQGPRLHRLRLPRTTAAV